jgi:gliding motility-associated-like protein
MLRTYTIALLTFLCSITSLFAADYHWIGGSGNWSDLNHWATTSGGSIHPLIVPSPFDDVFFDGNSGFVAGDVVTIDVPAFCKDMDWTGALNSPQLTSTQVLGQDYLKIYGSLTLISNMDFQYGQDIEFLSTNKGNIITTGGQYITNNVIFNGISGSWYLQDSMSVDTFILVEGSFFSNSNSIRVGNFSAANNSLTVDTLDLFHSDIYFHPVSNVSNYQSLSSRIEGGTGSGGGTSGSSLSITGGADFIIEADTISNLSIRKWLRTNLDSTNFYGLANLAANIELILVDTANILNGLFVDGVASIEGNGTVHIEKVISSGLVINDITTLNELIHIDSIFTFGTGNINKCECNYVHIHGIGEVTTGLYQYVDIESNGTAKDGAFNYLNINGNGNIQDGTFNYININGAANVKSSSDSTFVGKIILNSDGNIGQWGNTAYPLKIDTIKMTAGKTYNFKGTTTITQNGWIDAIGNCDGYITLKSKNSNQFGIECLGDTIQIEHCIIKNSTAYGGAIFIGNNSIDNGGNSGWLLTTPQSRALYWIGSQGEWSDSSHWSLTSGGVGGECMPSRYDDIYFDINSGFIPNDSVFIDIPIAYCRSMDWTGSNNNPTFTQQIISEIQIYGSLTFIQNMNYRFNDQLKFLSTNKGNTITTGSQYIIDNAVFNGVNGSWYLQDSMSIRTFTLIEGSFFSNSNSIRVGNFSAANNSLTVDTLDLFHSNIYFHPVSNVSNYQSLSSRIEGGTGGGGGTSGSVLSITGGADFIIEADTISNLSTRKWLRTNLDSTNFYGDSSLAANIELILVDTANILNGFFVNGIASIEGNGTVYIEKVISSGLVINDITALDQLIHIDSILTFGTGNINKCECDYTYIKGNGSVKLGLYKYVDIDGTGIINGGYFDYIDIDFFGRIEALTGNTSLFNGTYIGEIILNSDGYIGQWGNNPQILEIDSIYLTAGKTYNFKGTTIITQNGWISAIGNCKGYITLKSPNNNSFNIQSIAADTLQVEYCIIENSTASGGATFIGNNSIDNGGNIGWLLTAPQSRVLYWIGGQGLWSDSSHWSLISGGFGGECMPSRYDDIYFDNNSGFIPNDSVFIDIPIAYCRSMDWTGSLNQPMFTKQINTELHIYGSLTLIPNMYFQYDDVVKFLSTSNGNMITTGHQYLNNQVYFNGTGGSWYLQDSMSVNYFRLEEGSFYSNSLPIRVGDFSASTSSLTVDTLDLFHSNIYFHPVSSVPFSVSVSLASRIEGSGSGNNFSITGASSFLVVSDTVNNYYTDQKWLRTNLDSTNFYGNSSLYSTVELILTDTAQIINALFIGGEANISGNNTVYIQRIESWKLKVNTSTFLDELIHIDSSFIYLTGDINKCECDYIYIQGAGKVATGLYQYVDIRSNGTAKNGVFNYLNINGNGNIQDGNFRYININGTANIKSSFDSTFIGKIILNSDGNIGQWGNTAYPLEIDTIKLTAGKTYKFKETTTITQNGWVDAIGTGSFPILMRSQSIGTQATIKSLNDTICMNYIFMQDLDTAGTALFRAGEISVDISNNTGWEFKDCCSTFEISELFKDHDTTICIGESIDMLVYYGQCDGCTFSWSDGDTSEFRTITPTSSAVYYVTATKPQGCSSTDSIVINVIPIQDVYLANDTIVSDTSLAYFIDYQPQGGSWLGNGVSNIGYFNPSVAGNGIHEIIYSLDNGNSCVTSDTMVITVSSDACLFGAVNLSNYNSYGVSCFGGNNGSAKVTTLLGNAPYTYLWSNGNTDSIATNLSAGLYKVTVTDNSGCIALVNVNILEPPLLTANAYISSNYNGQAISFPGANDGEATATGNGGVTPYSYLWNTMTNNVTAFNLSAATYTVTLTDNNGCSAIDNVTLSEPTGYLSQVVSISDYSGFSISCPNSNDGVTNVNITGGTQPYTYLWNNGQTDSTATGLGTGLAIVTITDANNYSIVDSILLTAPDSLAIEINTTDSISCNGVSDGSLITNVVGGVPNYTYLWNNSITTSNQSNLGNGTYEVTITDNNGCTDIATFVLTEPSALVISISQDSVYNGFGVSCNGSTDGSITTTATGGTIPYTYNWSNGQTTAIANNTAAGTHTVTVTDTNGCTIIDSIIITEPTALGTTTQVTSDFNGFSVSCNGNNDGTASITAAGGTGNYTYSWTNGQTTATNLTAGTHFITITDANNCSTVDSVLLTEPTILTASASVTSDYNGQDISFIGASDGEATAIANGGTGTYTYLWSDGQTTAIATNLSGGTYTVTITDANNCTTTANVTLIEPSDVEVTFTVLSNYNGSPITCNGANDGSASASITGGTLPYTFNWSNGQTDSTATNLVGGLNTVTITDANGFSKVDSLTLAEPIVLNTSITITSDYNNSPISCNGESDGAVIVTITGGTIPYTYNWSNGQTTAIADNIAAGTHIVTVTDANGCTIIDSIIITEPTTLSTTTQVTSNFNGFSVSCNGNNDGTASITTAGGTGNYTYLWTNGQTTATATILTAGTHFITITDANNCSTVDSVLLTEPTILTASASVTSDYNGQDISFMGASDGEATAIANGGTGTYTHVWSDGQTTEIATNLSGGIYTVTITDANNCTTTANVTLVEPSDIEVTFTVLSNYNGSPITCNGASDGSASASITGGTLPYTFNWSNGQTDSTATNLVDGLNTVTVTDANGFSKIDTLILAEPTVLNTSITITSDYNNSPISCNGMSDGAVIVTTTGGTTPYTYNWSNGQTTATANNIAAETHTVTITDTNGCTIIDSIIITEPTTLSTTTQVTSNFNGFSVSCNGNNDGTASITTAGGTGNYTYLWTNGQTTATATILTAGTYFVTVTDANNCSTVDSVLLTEPTILTASASVTSDYNGQSISCFGYSDGSSQIVANDGASNYTYLWSNGQTDSLATNLSFGTHYVTVTDANGCMTSDSVSLNQPITLSNTLSTIGTSCNGLVGITANPTDGTGNYTYQWSTNTTDTFSSVVDLPTGTYSVTVTDANNCQITDAISVITFEPLTVNLGNDTTICIGQSVIFDATTPNIVSYTWQNATTNSTFSTATAGTYHVEIIDTNGCIANDTIQLLVNEVIPNIGVDTAICDGSQWLLDATQPSMIYNWQDGSTNATFLADEGIYQVTLTDTIGCIGQDSIAITYRPTADLGQDFTFICDSVNFTLTSNISGNYTWSDGSNNNILTTNQEGTYILEVVDLAGCYSSDTVTVTQVTHPSIYLGNDTILCNQSNYLLDATTTFTRDYQWQNGSNSATFNTNISGNYSIELTDNFGCVANDTISITFNEVAVDLGRDTLICFNNTLNLSAGTATHLTYTWQDGSNNSTYLTTTEGLYYATATDSIGCTDSDSITIAYLLTVNIQDTVLLNCTNVQSVITPNLTVGQKLWSNGSTNATFIPTTAGTVWIQYTDLNNCISYDTTQVIEPPLPPLELGNDTLICENEILMLSVAHPDIVDYKWQDGSDGDAYNIITAGIYNVAVTGANGCMRYDTIDVAFFAQSLFNHLTIDTTICENIPWLLDATVQGGIQYQWQDGTSTADYNVSNTGTYTVTATSAEGCTIDYSVTVGMDYMPKTASHLPTDTIVCQNNRITLNAYTEHATDYEWVGESAYYGQNMPQDSTFIITYSGTYSVTVSNRCSGFTQYIEVEQEDCGCYPYVPNGFSPNADGTNDEFQVYANCTMQDFQMNIFDRQGNQVFITSDVSEGWDGTFRGQEMGIGVFVWQVQFKALNAKGELETQVMSGDVTVLR